MEDGYTLWKMVIGVGYTLWEVLMGAGDGRWLHPLEDGNGRWLHPVGGRDGKWLHSMRDGIGRWLHSLEGGDGMWICSLWEVATASRRWQGEVATPNGTVMGGGLQNAATRYDEVDQLDNIVETSCLCSGKRHPCQPKQNNACLPACVST